jgi:hypothetical protein
LVIELPLKRAIRFVRKRVEWKLTARRHRKLDPPNMSELPWARYCMDEPNGEIFDRRTFSKRAALRRFKANGYDFGEITVERRYARYMTTQEIWAARDRTEQYREEWLDAEWERTKDLERATALSRGVKPPEIAPAGWEPDSEWDPAWQFCSEEDPEAAPVWLCEIVDV